MVDQLQTTKIINRFGLYNEMPGIVLDSQFVLNQIDRVSKPICMSRCSANNRCISIAYGSQMCILYSTDPRSHFDESAIIRSDASNYKMMLLNEGMKSTCYVNYLKASTASELAQCGTAEKPIDSNCTEWSEWEYVFASPCGERANFIKYKSRERNCTQPLFGGDDCAGNRYEKYEKGPRLFDDPS